MIASKVRFRVFEVKLFMVSPGLQLTSRITSYNVCYTKLLRVSDRVDHCRALADLLTGRAVPVRVLTGRTPPEERGRIVSEVLDNKVKVLLSTLQLIGEGFDCPGLSTLVLPQRLA